MELQFGLVQSGLDRVVAITSGSTDEAGDKQRRDDAGAILTSVHARNSNFGPGGFASVRNQSGRVPVATISRL